MEVKLLLKCILVITRYPIKGVTEYISNNVQYSFKTKARQQLVSELKISLTVITTSYINII